ncbi:AAA family ATPase [Streptomyces sp. NRRL B-1677]|uniref:AAA family ATPase n=1 Tax=Streptomyces sp. NRRL B-1677 TaxID=2682966 RepID=UPI001892947C|nr:AAA family ATPase [Streptomyces sp. NRRL B-1677]MBF6047737.1 AAA family ATPase [Streptomyces sp. NRRL B-1677]
MTAPTARERILAAVPDSPSEAAVPVPTTWQRVDLGPVLDGTRTPPQPTIGRRDDGAGLFYPGRLHSIFAEPEAMKTWLALTVATAELALGNAVVYLDFEDEEGGIVSRLLALGAPAADIAERFHYFRPDGPFGDAGRAALAPYLTKPTTFAVVDGVTEAMGMFGLKPKDDTDVAGFWRILPRWLAEQGPAVLLLDHVNKDRENRGRWATGSQHKLSGLNGCAFVLENITPLAPGQTGKSRMRVAKDRPGQVRKNALPGSNGALHWFADFVVESQVDGSAMVSMPAPVQHDGPFRPTALMKRVSDALSTAREPLSVRGVLDRVSGKQDAVRRALALLVDEGYVSQTPGARNAQLHELKRPFTDSND